MTRPLALKGLRKRIVFAVCADGSSPGELWFDGLPPKDKAKLFVTFEKLGNHGRVDNVEKFKKIQDTDFFEFKSHQIRMPCYFMPNGLVVITHGFIKKGNRLQAKELARAQRIRDEDALIEATT